MTTVNSARKDKILLLLKDRPSILRSTLFHGGIRIVSAIVGWVCMVIATGLIIISCLDINLFYRADASNQDIHTIILILELIVGIVMLVLAIALLFIAHLCRAIMVRNDYINSLEALE